MTETVVGPHPKRSELRALTGLRAVAALAVVVSHTGVPTSAPEPIRELAGWGYVGVPLFFMLSGFVLAYNYPDLSIRDLGRTVRFYVARIARVMPLYWLMLIYCASLYAVVGHVQYRRVFVLDVFGLQTWGGDLLAAQSRYNGPGWSIGVELFFYALFPLLAPLIAWLYRRWSQKAMVAIVVVGALVAVALWLWFWSTGRAALPAQNPASAHRWLYRNPLPHLVEFVVGMAAAYLMASGLRIGSRGHHLLQAAVVAYVIGLATLRPPSSSLIAAGSYGALWVIPFAVLVISLGSGRGWFARLLSTGPMVTLGTASYALYLTHRWFLFQLTGGKQVATGSGWEPYLALGALVVVLLLIAEGAHRYVEVPSRQAILRLTSRVGSFRSR
jgi:peptidoglycan/LPS O-acetylase OafA/YrhL